MNGEHKRESFADIEQLLIEDIGDFLDSEGVTLYEQLGNFCDPVKREETDLHLRMASAAMEIYKQTVKEKQ